MSWRDWRYSISDMPLKIPGAVVLIGGGLGIIWLVLGGLSVRALIANLDDYRVRIGLYLIAGFSYWILGMVIGGRIGKALGGNGWKGSEIGFGVAFLSWPIGWILFVILAHIFDWSRVLSFFDSFFP